MARQKKSQKREKPIRLPLFKGHPEGRQLPALERNILKYRALEMVLFLYYAEELKRFVVRSLESTRRLIPPKKGEPVLERGGKKLEKAWKILVRDGVLSESEVVDLRSLVDYRNMIAHRVHELTFDISRDEAAQSHRRFAGSRYDYEALGRLRAYYDQLGSSFGPRYVVMLSLSPLLFEATVSVFDKELSRLRTRIDRQIARRTASMQELSKELAREEVVWRVRHREGLLKTEFGRLTRHGTNYCEELFRRGRSALSVAYLLGISRRSVERRYKRWGRDSAGARSA